MGKKHPQKLWNRVEPPRTENVHFFKWMDSLLLAVPILHQPVWGVSQKQTIAIKGGEGVSRMLTIAERGRG